MATFRPAQRDRTLRALREFYATDLDTTLAAAPEAERRVLALFEDAARSVPAYADFLAHHGVDPARVTTLEAFRELPFTSKQSYHQAHSLAALCRDGALDACDMLAVSSGSTGQPTVWPRFVTDELATARRFEQVLADAFEARERSTLGVVCFALGTWVGGMYTTDCCRHLASAGYPITLVTPGNNIAEILRVVRELGPRFEQVVLFGYPPFVKDAIDAGRADGLDWSALRVRLVLAGEVFSEAWRSLVCERIGARDPARATASLYGTADGGVLANETPWSIRIRRALSEQPTLAEELFGSAQLPTLAQYDPCHRYFESTNGELAFSGDGGAPLLRYRILDRGGLFPPQVLAARLAAAGVDVSSEGEPRRELPFVYVFGRSSFAVSFYGANVYPENVAPALEQPAIARHVTGKFVLEVTRDADENAGLRVTVELASGATESAELSADLARDIRREIERVNSEFRSYAPADRRTPHVVLRPLRDPEYFPAGVKHRYTRGDGG